MNGLEDSRVPAPPGEEEILLHTRTYAVRTFRITDSAVRIRAITTLFGGPSGCTHVGALLRAMAPVAVQSMYSMQLADPDGRKPWDREGPDSVERERSRSFIQDSCHVWASDGEFMTASANGESIEAPIWIETRLEKLGRSHELDTWR